MIRSRTDIARSYQPVPPFLTILPIPAFARARVWRATARLAEAPQARRRRPQRVLTVTQRLGFAFRINDKTVFRGGYGIFYPTSAAQCIRDALESAPFNQGRTKDNRPDLGQPLLGFPGGLNGHGISPLTGGRLLAASTVLSANVIPFNLHQPRIHQFNFTFERELGRNIGLRISYLGTRMQRLIAGQDLNEIVPSSTPFGTTIGDGVTICDPFNNGDCDLSPADIARRPFPELGDFLASYGNIGNGKSNALQIQVTRRFTAGFSFDASYTLLDQKSNVGDAADSGVGGGDR